MVSVVRHLRHCDAENLNVKIQKFDNHCSNDFAEKLGHFMYKGMTEGNSHRMHLEGHHSIHNELKEMRHFQKKIEHLIKDNSSGKVDAGIFNVHSKKHYFHAHLHRFRPRFEMLENVAKNSYKAGFLEGLKQNISSISAPKDKITGSSRVEQTMESLKTILETSIAIKTRTIANINNMDRAKLSETAKSIMKDISSAMDIAQSMKILANIPEDCCCCITFDDSGKCTSVQIYHPDGSVSFEDMNKIEISDIFTDSDLEALIKQLSDDDLKNFCQQSNDPFKAFSSLIEKVENKSFDEQLTQKIEKVPSQIDFANELLKGAKTKVAS